MRLVAIVVLGGCQVVFPFTGDPPVAPDSGIGIAVPSCPGLELQKDPVPLVGLDGELFDATIFADELWMTEDQDGDRKLRLALRDTDGVYDTPVIPAFADVEADEYELGMSGDGLRLVFLTNRDDLEPRVFESTRPTRGETFGRADPVAGLPLDLQGLDLSFDGLVLYFTDSEMQVRAARRQSVDLPFGTISVLGDAQGDLVLGASPSISPDELELFYTFGDEIFRRVRPERDGQFGPPMPIGFGSDPDLSDDGDALVYTTVAGQLETRRRACE